MKYSTNFSIQSIARNQILAKTTTATTTSDTGIFAVAANYPLQKNRHH